MQLQRLEEVPLRIGCTGRQRPATCSKRSGPRWSVRARELLEPSRERRHLFEPVRPQGRLDDVRDREQHDAGVARTDSGNEQPAEPLERLLRTAERELEEAQRPMSERTLEPETARL